MAFSRHTLRSSAWLALLACLLLVCWPVVANVSPYAQPILIEVCALEGARYVPVDGKTAPSPDAQHHLPHCAFCSAVAGKVAPPPVVSAGAVRVAVSTCTAARPPARTVPASISLHAPNPRGPPVSV